MQRLQFPSLMGYYPAVRKSWVLVKDCGWDCGTASRENTVLLIISPTMLNAWGEVTAKRNSRLAVSQGQWPVESTRLTGATKGVTGVAAVATCLQSVSYIHATSSIPRTVLWEGINMITPIVQMSKMRLRGVVIRPRSQRHAQIQGQSPPHFTSCPLFTLNKDKTSVDRHGILGSPGP